MQMKVSGKVTHLAPSRSGRAVVFKTKDEIGAMDIYLQQEIMPPISCAEHGIVERDRIVVAWNNLRPSAIAVMHSEGDVSVFSTDGAESAPPTVLRRRYYSACFSANGECLYLGGIDGRVSMWKCGSAADAAAPWCDAPETHGDIVTCMDWAPRDGQGGGMLVTGSLDGTVRTWDAFLKTCIKTRNADAPVHDVRVSPDGTRIMACTSQFVVITWEAGSETALHRIESMRVPLHLFMFPGVFEYIEHENSDHFVVHIAGARWQESVFVRPRGFHANSSAAACNDRSIWVGYETGHIVVTPIPTRRPDMQSDCRKESGSSSKAADEPNEQAVKAYLAHTTAMLNAFVADARAMGLGKSDTLAAFLAAKAQVERQGNSAPAAAAAAAGATAPAKDDIGDLEIVD